jgi:hypothetical protein
VLQRRQVLRPGRCRAVVRRGLKQQTALDRLGRESRELEQAPARRRQLFEHRREQVREARAGDGPLAAIAALVLQQRAQEQRAARRLATDLLELGLVERLARQCARERQRVAFVERAERDATRAGRARRPHPLQRLDARALFGGSAIARDQ